MTPTKTAKKLQRLARALGITPGADGDGDALASDCHYRVDELIREHAREIGARKIIDLLEIHTTIERLTPAAREDMNSVQDQPHVVLALVGERVENGEYINVGTIVMAEYASQADADTECHRRNALVKRGHRGHRGREYITMSAAEYATMSTEE